MVVVVKRLSVDVISVISRVKVSHTLRFRNAIDGNVRLCSSNPRALSVRLLETGYCGSICTDYGAYFNLMGDKQPCNESYGIQVVSET